MTLFRNSAFQSALEILLIFAIFFVEGAWPVPDTNEAHYVLKTIHFWNKEVVPNDPFLQSADAHWTFYYTIGWLSLWLEPEVFVWVGRLFTWLLLAWGWQQLGRATVARWGAAALAAAIFACVQERFHMAGEWVIGGLEAKGLAFAFLWFALASMIRGHWGRALLLLGAATAFHVLVGGWAVIAAACYWVSLGSERPLLAKLRFPLVGMIVLALPGLIPALTLDWGADAETIRWARTIYLFRLGHHLSLIRIPPDYFYRFVLLVICWALVEQLAPERQRRQALRRFTIASCGFACVGAMLSLLEWINMPVAASVLRYYWFRLADVMVPVAFAVGGTMLAVGSPVKENWRLKVPVFLAIFLTSFHLAGCIWQRFSPGIPRGDQDRVADYEAWRDVCRWIETSPAIPRDSRFLTPRMAQTFKWYAKRPEVVNWKDIPQDARAIVQWWQALCEVHAYRDLTGELRWYTSLAQSGTEHVREVALRYGAHFAVTVSWPPLELPVLYRNKVYVVYRIQRESEASGNPPASNSQMGTQADSQTLTRADHAP